MITYIVLLRAVNVGGHGKIAMAEIRDCLNQAGGVHRGQLYATYPDGIGDSRLTSTVIGRATQCPVTARNLNLVSLSS